MLRLDHFQISKLQLPYVYSLTLIGPSLANVPEAKPLAAIFPIAAAPNVPMILLLFCNTELLKLLTAPAKSPLRACCIDAAKPVLCAKDKAVPASIALILNDLLALRLGALRRLTAMLTDFR